MVTKTFGSALGTSINEWTISAKIEYNAIDGVTSLSRSLVYFSFVLTIISAIIQSIQLHKDLKEKTKLDEEFGYKMASEA